jgi:hypothetical protein
MKDLKCLLEAIKSYGFSYYEGQALISSFAGVNGTKVDVAMDMNGNRNLGFNKNSDGTYEFCGDFYGLKDGEKTFVDKFVQRYSTIKIKAALKKKGLHVTETETNGTIKLVVNL